VIIALAKTGEGEVGEATAAAGGGGATGMEETRGEEEKLMR
jgi:hypothetical protein